MSIFINPTQFAPTDDFDSYPKTFDSDIARLTAAGASAVFAPTSAAMYSDDFSMFVTPAGADDLKGEGTRRPGFFRGVCTVVTKLFNIVQPDRAFFGQKDGLQSNMVQKLVRDLNMPLTVTICPTVRERDGLAMSSRNVYLSEAERAAAPVIYQALLKGREAWHTALKQQQQLQPRSNDTDTGITAETESDVVDVSGVRAAVTAALQEAAAKYPFQHLDYVFLSDCVTGVELSDIPSKEDGSKGAGADCVKRGRSVMLAVAVKSNTTRLIDNIILTPNADQDMI